MCSKHVSVTVDLTIEDDIEEKRVRELVKAMVENLEQDENFIGTDVEHVVEAKDISMLSALDILDEIKSEHIEQTGDAINERFSDET